MKAKEYAAQYSEQRAKAQCNEDVIRAGCEIALAFLKETGGLIKSRQAKRTPAITAIFNEQNAKWKALCRLQDDFLPGGYEAAVKDKFPELYRVWMHYRT